MAAAAATGKTQFGSDMARFYQDNMVPMVFEPYANHMAIRAAMTKPMELLEVAAGTGVVTRHLAQFLPGFTNIVATDISEAMLNVARYMGAARTRWMVADAMALPFPDQAFDTVICQFGMMFFSNRPKAMEEMLRVLRPGGTLIFSVWAAMASNEFVSVVNSAVSELFPGEPMRFFNDVPHGYHDKATIARELREAGFTGAAIFEQIDAASIAPSPRHVAVAYCNGTPMSAEINARDPEMMDEAVDRAEAAIAARFGSRIVTGKTLGHFVSVTR